MPEEKTRSGRRALVDAAERLIAEHGPAVSLRQVLTAAGQRNSSAIRYHFGSRQRLIGAIVDTRQHAFEPKRLERLAELEAEGEVTARRLIQALLEPVFEHQRDASPSYHARFMEKIRDYPGVELVRRDDWGATRLIMSQLARLASPVHPSQRATHRRGLISVVFALLADLERAEYSTLQDREAAEQATIDMILGVVRSGSTAEPAEPAEPAVPSRAGVRADADTSR